jgi:hypothetical protein
MGRYIGRGREWVSRLENDKGKFSDYVMLRIEELERMQSHHIPVIPAPRSHLKTGGPVGTAGATVEETEAPYPADAVVEASELIEPSTHAFQRTIRDHIEGLLRAAGHDVQRLGWIAEQLRQHVSEPHSWGKKERLLRERLEANRVAHPIEVEAKPQVLKKGPA